MALFMAMLPLYFLGNIHCLGMCGPLAALLGSHRFRWFYLWGRLLSFGLAGFIAGEAGAVLQLLFQGWHLSGMVTLLFGLAMALFGVAYAAGYSLPGIALISKKAAPLHQKISLFLLKDTPQALFLFGAATILLPCGQSLLVFSACALAQDAWVGLGNGLAFAALTSPALFLAMQAHLLLRFASSHYRNIVACSAFLVGLLAVLRGSADLGIIDHWSLYGRDGFYHIVIY